MNTDVLGYDARVCFDNIIADAYAAIGKNVWVSVAVFLFSIGEADADTKGLATL